MTQDTKREGSFLPARKYGDEKSGKTPWRRWLELTNLKMNKWNVRVWFVHGIADSMTFRVFEVIKIIPCSLHMGRQGKQFDSLISESE